MSSGQSASATIPPFEPHPWLQSGHAQTVVGRYLVNGNRRLESTAHEIALDDGDRLLVLESVPARWTARDPAVVLIHGLAGCANSAYVVRFGRRLIRMGLRVVRMNLRNAGKGFGLARGIYHAGRSDDVRRVIVWLARRVPGSRIAIAGFSLGGNLALKLAAESTEDPVEGLDCVLAANPPIDLLTCSTAMQRPENRFYDWNFVRWLRMEVSRLHRLFPELGRPELNRVHSLYDFDDRYTAPRNGFAGATDYYARSSALPLIPRIAAHGLVVHAADDPFIPAEPFLRAQFPASLQFELIARGGHLGYVSRHRWQGDRRWLEARLVAWLAERFGIATDRLDFTSSWPVRGRANLGVSNRHA
jgi:predicted alpha/beta-fold hydrolase